MEVAPAAVEKAVEVGAVVEVQQYAAAAAWVRQQAACMCVAAGGSGQGNDCNGQQAASVRVAVQWAADAACVGQRAVVAACVQQQAGVAGSTFAMGYSDGSGQPAAQLQWAAAAAVAQRTVGRQKNCVDQQLR